MAIYGMDTVNAGYIIEIASGPTERSNTRPDLTIHQAWSLAMAVLKFNKIRQCESIHTSPAPWVVNV